MTDYVAWYGDGKAGGGLSCTHEDLLPPLPEGAEWISISGSCAMTTLALVGGIRTEVPISLPPESALALARAELLAAAKAYRDFRQGAGYQSVIGRVDTDFERSLPLINNMASAAAGSIASKTTFPLKKWTLADGSQVDITPAKGVAIGAGVNGMLDACQQAYATIKAQINAARTIAALASVDITADYPA